MIIKIERMRIFPEEMNTNAIGYSPTANQASPLKTGCYIQETNQFQPFETSIYAEKILVGKETPN